MRRVNTRFMGRGSSLKNGYISQGRGIFFSELFYAHNLNALNFIPGADVSISTWSPTILETARAIILKRYILHVYDN